MWFERLTGFVEESPDQVRSKLAIEGNRLRSLVNGKTYVWGELETPTLADLRERVREAGTATGQASVREVVANVQDLHADRSNAGAFFQVASQFNLLEMVGPDVTPERGVGIYERDRTQGPACAIAAGAGTIYRNYFAAVNGETGQSASNQIDCLADMGLALDNTRSRLWTMKNGYALATREGLAEITDRLRTSSEDARDQIRQRLRIGLQWNTQVTLEDCTHTVSQAYGSALPVAYSRHDATLWAPFATLVLEASYEATLCAASLNAARTGNPRVFLTMLGGGAFGNETGWILSAIRRAVSRPGLGNLDMAIVSYGASSRAVRQFIESLA